MRLGIGLHITGLRAGGDVAPFTPADLFASGEEGVWYEPSTTTTFASTTDLTPCAVGDTCGFFLDKSQGAGYSGGSFTGLGAEGVANGAFDSGAGWTLGGNWTIAGGTINHAASGTSYPTGEATISAGKAYLVSFDIVSETVAGSGVSIQFGSAGPITPFGVSGVGTKEFILTATSNETFIRVAARGGTGDWVGSLDNISAKEIPGNHATQATLASRPILRQTGGGVFYLEDDEVDDAINWTAPTDTDYTVAYVNTSGTVTTLTGQSLSGATDILLDPALVGYVAVDRALTAGEAANLETYLGGLV